MEYNEMILKIMFCHGPIMVLIDIHYMINWIYCRLGCYNRCICYILYSYRCFYLRLFCFNNFFLFNFIFLRSYYGSLLFLLLRLVVIIIELIIVLVLVLLIELVVCYRYSVCRYLNLRLFILCRLYNT